MKHIQSALKRFPPIDAYMKNPSVFQRAWETVRIFYIALVFIVVISIPLILSTVGNPAFDPIPPLWFLRQLPQDLVLQCILAFSITGVLVGAIFWTYRLGRIAALAGIFIFHGALSTFGQPNHQLYPFLYTAALFAFLPSFKGDEEKNNAHNKRRYLLLLWGAQAWFLLLYTMSGSFKLVSAVRQLMGGQISSFHPFALALQVANWRLISDTPAPFATLLLAMPILGWLPYLLTMYLELFALWAAVRPSIQKVWAIGLISFHLGTQLVMGISFAPWILLLMVFFFASPFCTPKSPREIIYDLPVVGWGIRTAEKIFRAKRGPK